MTQTIQIFSKQAEMSNKKTKLEKDFEAIMDGYQGNNPLIHQEWVKRGDYYEQYSVYDESLVTVSGILN